MNKGWEVFKKEKDECEYVFHINEGVYAYLRVVDLQEALGKFFNENRYNIMYDTINLDDIDNSFIDDILDEYEDESSVDAFVLAVEYGRENISIETSENTLDDVLEWIEDNVKYKPWQLSSNIDKDMR